MLGRCRRRVLLCDLGEPRPIHALHGYLTRDGIAPPEFNKLGRRELSQYGVEVRCVGVTGATLADDSGAAASKRSQTSGRGAPRTVSGVARI